MTEMALLLCSISASFINLLWTPVVSSYTFCSWKPININTDSNAQLSFQCTDPSTPIIIIENATIGFAYNNMNGNCTTYIGCSQQVIDFTQYCTGYNTPCSLNQQVFFTLYDSQTCNGASLNYVYVNYSCIAANVPPSDICNSQQSLSSTGVFYLSTSNSFPLSNTFPYAPIQCSCSFKPLDQTVTANISIRALIVDLEDFTSCSQKLTIHSCSTDDTVFCSRSSSSNVTTYVQLGSNLSISFQSNSTNGHFLLEIRTLTSAISGMIGVMTCSRSMTPSCSTSSTNLPSTSVSRRATTRNTRQLTTNVNPRIQDSTSSFDPSILTTNVAVDNQTFENTPADVGKQGSNSNTISTGAIGGIVVGFVVLVTFLIIVFVYFKRKSKKPSKYTDSSDTKCTQMSGRRIPYLEPVDVKNSSPDFETSPTTYQALNSKSLELYESKPQHSVEYQTLQRPYDTRLLDVNMSDQQKLKASHTEPVNKVGSSPVYENELSQNYQALHFDEKKARQNEPCATDYQILHHLHDTNYNAHVTSMFQRSTLYEPSRIDSAPQRSGNKIGLHSPLYQNL